MKYPICPSCLTLVLESDRREHAGRIWHLVCYEYGVPVAKRTEPVQDLLALSEREQCAYRIGSAYGNNPRCKRWALPISRYCRQHDLKVLVEKARRTPLPVVER